MTFTRSTRSKASSYTRAKAQSHNSGRKTRARAHVRYPSLDGISHSDEESEYEISYRDDDTDIEVSSCSSVESITRIPKIGNGHELFVHADSGGGALFKKLPLEVHQQIIKHLPTDRDVAYYARLSYVSRSAVSSSVWRQRFEQEFDTVEGLPSSIIADRYRRRKEFFKKWVIFDTTKLRGAISNDVRKQQYIYQKECIERLTDMILESKSYKSVNDNGDEVTVELNMQVIREVTSDHEETKLGEYLDILDALFEDDYTQQPRGIAPIVSKQEKIMIIQLCLSSIILHPNTCNTKVSHFDMSQTHVYGAQNDVPLFSGRNKQRINLVLLLHTVNFFKFHFKATEGEGILAGAYRGLHENEYPQTWLGNIKSGTQELGSHWKGAYTWMDDRDLMRLRTCNSNRETYSDVVNDEEGLQDMTFYFDDDQFPLCEWPPGFDPILDSDPYSEHNRPVVHKRQSPRKRTMTCKRPEIKQFWGTSRGATNGHMFGRVHALNNQHDVHGWQRVTIMKIFEDENGDYDPSQVWAYEGVVLPGGRMILGRWRHARANPATPEKTASGPFIFWNVDKSSLDVPIDPAEALEFAKTINDPLLMGF